MNPNSVADVRAGDVLLPSTGRRHRRLTAAVVEEVEICVPEVAIRDAVDDVVEAGFGQSQPGGVVKHFIGDVLRCGRVGDGEDDAERQPENHERQEAVKVAPDERKVRLVHDARLERGLTHEFFGVNYDADVNEECDEQRQ